MPSGDSGTDSRVIRKPRRQHDVDPMSNTDDVDPRITLVVARDLDGAIGRDNELPWRLPADLAHFKRVTMGKPLVMGRLTHESIGRALPGRENMVITSNPERVAAGCRAVATLDEALALAEEADAIMVIGGERVFAEALPRAGRIELTEVHARVGGDTFFPALKPGDWREVAREDHAPDERNELPYSFVTLVRRAGSD